MGSFWQGLLLTAATLAFGRDIPAQPSIGSQLDPEENLCATCHGESDLWEKDTRRLYVSLEAMAEDVHFRSGVNCHDCHGGDPSNFEVGAAHSTQADENQPNIVPFRSPLNDVWQVCGNCHTEQKLGMLRGVHRRAETGDGQGGGRPINCSQCHGNSAHPMVSVRDSRSNVFLDKQVNVCGDCHKQELEAYKDSVHGHGLYESGLLVTAACADCHGAHGIHPASHEQSTLHATNVSATCAACHRYIEQRLARSVHGRGDGPGRKTDAAALAGEERRRPTCTDCHAGHDLALPRTDRFRLGLASRCGQCHADFSGRYAISMHGELTELGYGPAANCSDCHGAHDILPVSEPDSKLSAANRHQTCTNCHPRASRNFLDFDPHADHRDPRRNLLLFCVYTVLITLLISTFSFFALHSLFWFVRSLFDVLKNGRPKSLIPGAAAYVRFGPRHRMAHTIMVISFLGLAVTGLPLKYSHCQWAQTLAFWFGGFESTGVWHRLFGVVNIGVLVLYVFWMLRRLFPSPRHGASRIGLVFGPDSPVPTRRDLTDFLKMVRWFFGQGPKPTFERWTYWEKYDFWGAFGDIVVIGFTGLILWFPHLFCAYLPGQVLNIAKVIHSTQALLATGFVFAIHFFNTHLRPEKFPMDMSVLTGVISEEEANEERSEFFDRMRQEGRLDGLRTTVPPRPKILSVMLGGFVALAIGLGLLAGIVLPILQVLVRK
ncbi:MAG: cytochrome c3 family protein [Planctomycetes bacterium]|nr:cytochrome c3 family protein [Planctomycetota bacterium]